MNFRCLVVSLHNMSNHQWRYAGASGRQHRFDWRQKVYFAQLRVQLCALPLDICQKSVQIAGHDLVDMAIVEGCVQPNG